MRRDWSVLHPFDRVMVRVLVVLVGPLAWAIAGYLVHLVMWGVPK